MVGTIKSRQEFERVYRLGERFNHRLVRMTVLREAECAGKLAFVAPRRLGCAVFRNRCKRVLREAARMCGLPADGCLVILFATRATHGSSPASVASGLSGLLRRAGVHGG